VVPSQDAMKETPRPAGEQSQKHRTAPDSAQIELVLRAVLDSQRFAVLATHSGGQPYVSLMAFAATSDLGELIFATERDTRKYANLCSDARTAVLVDSRSNRSSDIQDAVAVTVIGRAEEAEGDDRDHLLRIYVAKHPNLERFATSPSCALVRVKVASYRMVSQFQEVQEVRIRQREREAGNRQHEDSNQVP
jgi:nitroimidazol reductase NimA-like FMN-containing flavoprotein (pyridoxamine 5'-phosphate oxidase superfamily)